MILNEFLHRGETKTAQVEQGTAKLSNERVHPHSQTNRFSRASPPHLKYFAYRATGRLMGSAE
ncbi:MAG: hypothetical protein CMJ47_00655 [Planctomyces sp.]|nr:hypothetical protein [Planctomyces sp.]